ncbi:hypothetical protein Rhopal_001288-T1 [Rhodotorula paludigena]|uniref:Proteophosphoglycan ppg4 n=1 Tax=Rhodotorula paludigena TaxID=86838 RepID=A0AAV5GDF1_9BASI|nr:hypothetical protein Rhopal_001288-T1 [Rhodotorula paludigena]
MAPLVALLAHLPKIRQTCLTLVLIAGVFDFVASIVLLAYQLALTVSFQHVVPSIVAASFLCAFFPLWFLYSRPYSIRLPGAEEAKVGGTRDKVAKFSRSIAAELIALAGTGVLTLISVSTLHAETPGLIDHCGGYAICRMLLAVFALTWICFLFLCLAFTSLLVSTLYFSIRRSSPFPILTKSFLAIDWERYAGRPVNRAATVKRAARSGKGGKRDPNALAPRTLEGEEGAELERRMKRDDSVSPVLPHALSHSASGWSHARNGSDALSAPRMGALDWDVQSTLTSGTGGARGSGVYGAYGREGGAYGSEPGTPRREDQVFVLHMPEGEAVEAPFEGEKDKEGKSVGAAM